MTLHEQERQRLEAELLDYLYDCSDDPTALERRIAEEPEVAALLEEVRATKALLDDAAQAEAPALDLAPPAPAKPRVWRTLLVAAIALLVAGPWTWTAIQEGRRRDLEEQFLRLVVSGPTGVPSGAPTRVRVETWGYTGEPGAATVAWRALDADGAVLDEGTAESDGAYDLDVPAHLVGVHALEVRAERAGAVRETSFALFPGREAPLVHLASDKPAYRPGETAFLRAVALDRLSLNPREGRLRARVVDPKGAPVQSWNQALEDGVLALSWNIGADAPGGEYALEIRDGGDEFVVESLPLLVRRYQPPQLAKTITLDRETYAPGEDGAAEVAVERVEGGIPAGARVDASLVLDGDVVWEERAALDARGRAIFAFQIPFGVERGEARFVARVIDGGVVETAVEPFVVPTGEVLVDLYPEGGELVAGTAARVYAECFDELERPTSARGRVVDGAGREVATFETSHQGRGRFEFVPRVNETYALELEEPTEATFELPAVTARGVALRAGRDGFGAGEAIELDVHTFDPGPWIAGVFCRGRLVAQDTFSGAGAQALSLDLPPEVAGVLRITIFDRELAPVAERLVHRASGRAVQVALRPEFDTLMPAEHQTIEVATTDETGRPVSAVLGLAVSDRAVRDYVDETRIGLADQTWLFADVEALEDVEEFLLDDPDAAEHVDLLLGTRGWRRFAWLDATELLEERGDEAKRLLLREGRVDRPQVADLRGDVPALLASARRDVRKSRGVAILASLAAAVLALGWGVSRLPQPIPQVALGLGLAGVTVFALAYPRLGATARVELEAAMDFAPAAMEAPANGADWALEAEEDPEVFFAMGAPRAGGGAGGGPAGPGVPPPPGGWKAAGVAGLPGPAGPATPGRVAGGADAGLLAELEFDLPQEEMEDADGVIAAARDRNEFGGRFGGRPVPVRVYAHKRAPRGPNDPRVDFAETLFWHASLATSADGRARVEFDTSDRVTTWRVTADAHGAGRVGQAEASFVAVPPFHMEAKLPVELSAGDRVLLPVSLVSGDPSTPTAQVAASVAGPLELAEDVTGELALRDGRGRLWIPIDVIGTGDAAELRFAGTANGWTDRVGRTLRVVPRGFPRRVSKGGRVTESAEFVLGVPGEYVENSLSLELKLYPSPLAGLLEGVEGLLREPHGCFEQASAVNYPNVLAAAYLDAAGIEAPAAMARAREVMERGYAKLVGYECPDEGYEWFGGDPGHEALTAYGLQEFADMAAVFDVDPDMMARTRAWLMERRDGEGGYERNERALDSFGRAPQEITNAYCTYGLVLSGTPPEELEAELERMATRAVESEDAYEVALAAAALEVAGRAEVAEKARERLKTMQADDGSVEGASTSITSSGGNDLTVETTSLAILAWLADSADEAAVREAVEWLLAQRQGSGRFGATQATVQALRALVEYARVNRRVANDGELVVYVNDFETTRVAFEAGRREPIEVLGLLESLRPGENRIRLELTGGNEFPWSADLAYHAETPADDPDATIGIETSLDRRLADEGETVNVFTRVTNLTDEGRPMTLAVIGLPAGLEAPTKVLDDLKEAGRFDLWELRGREVILYWRDLAPREVVEVSLDCVATIPGSTEGPASRAYLYYTPELVRWALPLAIEVDPVR